MRRASADPWSRPTGFERPELADDPIEDFTDSAADTYAVSAERASRRARLASRSRSDSRRRPRVSQRLHTVPAQLGHLTVRPRVSFLPAVPLTQPHLLPGEHVQYLQNLLQRQQSQLSDFALEVAALRRVAAEQQMLASHRIDEVERRLRRVDALLQHIMQYLQDQAALRVFQLGVMAGGGDFDQGARDRLRRMSVEALTTAPSIAALTLPWETGPLAAIFGKPEVLPRPALDIEDVIDTASVRPLGPEPSETVPGDKKAFTAAWNKDTFRRDRLPERDRFNLVYQEWLQVILPWAGDRTVLGLMVSAAADQTEKLAVVTQTLAGKALSTLEKRLRQVKAFLAWALLASVTPFPMTEHACRMYLKKLVEEKAPASRIKGVLEMVGFLRHVVGLPVAENAGDSPWIRGVLRMAAANAKPTAKARPLTVGEVATLEAFVKRRVGALQDLYAAGCFLFLIFSRARFGDCKIISDAVFDIVTKSGELVGYIEVISWSHKMRRHFPSIPLVAPVQGATIGSWVESWRSIATDVGNLLIMEDTRTRLGNHNDRGSAECYGRDTLAAPLRDLEACILAIRTGSFLPDVSRSGYFPDMPDKSPSCEGSTEPQGGIGSSDVEANKSFDLAELSFGAPADQSDLDNDANASEGFEPDAIEHPAPSPSFHGSNPAQDVALDESSSSSTSSSSTDTEVESEPGPHLAALERPVWRDACQVWQHRQSRTVHLLPEADAESGSFVCGRVKSQAYFRATGHPIVDSLKCVQCDRGKTIRSTAQLVHVLDKRRRTG
ncbi:unnamed protein product [Symbiodinium sp. CCMP2592]|nr:unnamed protein product [Symbiodinium sp. CCMP2592]